MAASYKHVGMKIRNLVLLAGILTACSSPAPVSTAPNYDTSEPDLSTPEGTAYAMMIAMYRGDADLVDQVFHPDGSLTRIGADGSVKLGGREGWQKWVGTLKAGQANEELFSIKVEEFGNLATVWAPFVIAFDGKIVGCGVNQLSMAKSDDIWRIVSGMDVQAPKEDCADFKASYKTRN